jgi:hypothetical protein
MFRPALCPSSGRCITRDGYIKLLKMLVNWCAVVKYYILTLHGLKYILKCLSAQCTFISYLKTHVIIVWQMSSTKQNVWWNLVIIVPCRSVVMYKIKNIWNPVCYLALLWHQLILVTQFSVLWCQDPCCVPLYEDCELQWQLCIPLNVNRAFHCVCRRCLWVYSDFV